MHPTRRFVAVVTSAIAALIFTTMVVSGATRIPKLDSTQGLDLVSAQAEVVTWHGRRAIHLSPLPGQSKDDHAIMAVLTGTEFHDGVIELDVSGAPRADADPTSRGFVGLAFRVQGGDSLMKFECYYIRPTNGRS